MGDGLDVLLVDDNVDAADMLAESLRALGTMSAWRTTGCTPSTLAPHMGRQLARYDRAARQ